MTHREELLKAIAEARESGKLNLFRLKITATEFTEDISPLLEMGNIRELRWWYVDSLEAIKLLVETLKLNKTLVSVDLSNNKMQLDDIKALAEALKVNNTLKSLHLFDNYISIESIKALSDALKVNNTLTELYFSHDLKMPGGFKHYGPEAIEAMKMLAGAIEANKTLTKLVLNSLRIEPEAVRIVRDALKINKTLIHFGLGADSSRVEEGYGIPELLARNRWILQEKEEKKNQRQAAKEAIFTTRDKQDKAIPRETAIREVAPLLDQIYAFAGFASDEQNQREQQRQQELKQKYESSLNPLQRISGLITEIWMDMNSRMFKSLIITLEEKQKIKAKISEVMKKIQKDAENGGYNLQAADYKKIKEKILNYKEHFKADIAASEIANKLLSELDRMTDEYNKNPSGRILAFIERLTALSSGEFFEAEQQQKIKAEINERMESILTDNEVEQYSFQEDDVNRIRKGITAFENKFKDVNGMDNIAKILRDNYEKNITAAPKIALKPQEKTKVHLEPSADDNNPALQAALAATLSKHPAKEREQKEREDALQPPTRRREPSPAARQQPVPSLRKKSPSPRVEPPVAPPKSGGPKPPPPPPPKKPWR